MLNEPTYLIGEIGQNHNGSPDLAMLIIDLISRPVKEEVTGKMLCGMNAVKLTKRDLNQELSRSQMEQPYQSPHSFGKTYGEHRAFLELSDETHYDIYLHAKSKGLDFVETLCAPGCLSLLRYFEPDYLKVASRDLTNLPLLLALAETGIPMIVSTGMSGERELGEAVEVITRYHDRLSILHCVSQYPTAPSNVNLATIPFLQKRYPQFTIGYSDHTIGISTPVAACALGAKIIEKHITLDRRMKGSDQAGSLGPDGVHRMVRDIRVLEMALGKSALFVEPDTKSARYKLERSVATRRRLRKGDLVKESDLHLLSPGDGLKWSERHKIINKRVTTDVPQNEILYYDFVQ
ncbi:MAG: N-acetylneuraminate synthase family protein [Salibacteraceae bacterium]